MMDSVFYTLLCLFFPITHSLRGIINGRTPALHNNAAGYGEGMRLVGIHKPTLNAGVDSKPIRPGKRAARKPSVDRRGDAKIVCIKDGGGGVNAAESGKVTGEWMVKGEGERGGQVGNAAVVKNVSGIQTGGRLKLPAIRLKIIVGQRERLPGRIAQASGNRYLSLCAKHGYQCNYDQ